MGMGNLLLFLSWLSGMHTMTTPPKDCVSSIEAVNCLSEWLSVENRWPTRWLNASCVHIHFSTHPTMASLWFWKCFFFSFRFVSMTHTTHTRFAVFFQFYFALASNEWNLIACFRTNCMLMLWYGYPSSLPQYHNWCGYCGNKFLDENLCVCVRAE